MNRGPVESVVTKTLGSPADWLRQAVATKVKRGRAKMIEVTWVESKDPSKAGQQKPKPTWDVIVRDFIGAEFCRRSYKTEAEARKSEVELKQKLVSCSGDVLGALSDWAECKLQVPLWWR